MKQVAIYQQNGKVQGSGLQTFSMQGQLVEVGLLDIEPPEFNAKEAENAHQVLVQKIGFSCNYRDQGWILHAWETLKSSGGAATGLGLGSDFVGIVIAIGEQVSTLHVGDRVIPNSCYPAEVEGTEFGIPTNYSSTRLETLHEFKLMKVPDSMPNEVAAGFTVGAQTAYSLVRRMGIKPSDKVLVTSATSNTSLFVLNALRQTKAKVFALTTRGFFANRLGEFGMADVIVKDRQQSLLENDQLLNILQKIGGFNVVIDPFWDIYLKEATEVMHFYSRYVTCGSAMASFEIGDLYDSMQNIIYKNLQINGNCVGTTSDLEHALKDYQSGKLQVVIDSVFKGEKVKEFLERSFNSQERFGKVIYLYD